MKLFMRKVSLLMFLLVFTSCHAMQISTDRQIYSPLEEGILNIYVNVPSEYQRIIIEMEIYDLNGNLVYGDIMHSEIPESLLTQPVTESYTNISWQEIPEDGKVIRAFPFTIPATAYDGDYTIISKVFYQDSAFDSGSTSISIVGGILALGGLEIIFIVALIIGIIIWKEV
jgi:hypothetical protein